ncbi:hypothetical protein ACN083_08040 [Rothia sp. CCM 9418]|uniref:hypothetical protein n=1 Tax=Rothia sp. CCM 9418 TaxID=3402661 RepID=UPI003AE7436F
MDILIVLGNTSAQKTMTQMSRHLAAALERHHISYKIQHYEGSTQGIGQWIRQHSIQEQAQAVICVGYTLCFYAAQDASLDVPLMCALPDIPGTANALFDDATDKLETIASVSDLLFVADETSRSLLEYVVPGVSGRVRLCSDVRTIRSLLKETRTSQSNHRILVSSHDFRFISDAVYMLQRIPGVEVRRQQWQLSSATPPADDRSAESLEWADTILCEWAGRNAVWYSHHKRQGQRLFVRLHGFESRSAWIEQLNLSAVDKVFTVSEFYRESLINELGWLPSQVAVINNSISYHSFDRVKDPHAEFHLGMLGYTPLLKRPHLAVRILRQLLERDSRFILHFRGESPWNKSWIWQNSPQEADGYRQLYRLIGDDPLLREHIVFEPSGANVESWFTKIGWILSLSERETFHLAAAEGMASGAVPLFLQRTGVTEIFGTRWVFESPEDIASFIYHTVQAGTWQEQSDKASSYAARFDYVQSNHLWRKVLLGE